VAAPRARAPGRDSPRGDRHPIAAQLELDLGGLAQPCGGFASPAKYPASAGVAGAGAVAGLLAFRGMADVPIVGAAIVAAAPRGQRLARAPSGWIW